MQSKRKPLQNGVSLVRCFANMSLSAIDRLVTVLTNRSQFPKLEKN